MKYNLKQVGKWGLVIYIAQAAIGFFVGAIWTLFEMGVVGVG